MPVLRGDDGKLTLRTRDGIDLPWTLGEDELASLGHEIPPPPSLFNPSAGALAFGDTPERGNVPESRSDAGGGGSGGAPGIGGPGSSAGGVSGRSAAEGSGHQPGSERQEPAQPPAESSDDRAAAAAKKLRGGAEVKSVDTGAPGGDAQGPAPSDAPRYTRIKGGDVRAGYRVEKGLPKEQLGAVGASIAKSANADAAAVDAAGQQAMDLGAYEAKQLDEQFIPAQETKVAALRKKRDAASADIDARDAELQNERGKIASLEGDPHRYWASQSTGAKVISVIAAIASGINSGMKGGPNQYLDRLAQIIKDDKAERMAKIDARKRGASLKKTELDELREKMDPELADREIEARQLAVSAAMLRSFGLKTQNPAIIAKTDAEAATIEKAAQLQWAGISRDMADRVAETWQNIPDRVVQTGGQRALKPEERALAVTLPGGKTLFARSAPDANALRKRVASASYLKDRLGEVKGLVQRGKADRLWWAENKGQIQALMGDIAGSYKEAKELGTLDAGVERLLDKAVGDPDTILSWDDKAVAKISENERLQAKSIENVANYQLDASPSELSAPGGANLGTLERQ